VPAFIVLMFFIVVFGTVGEIFVSRAMKETGEVKNFRPGALIAVILRALRSKWMWLGVGMMAVGFFSLLAVFSFENVSFVVPVTALSYVVGALGGRFFLGERVNLQRWIGILLVCAGVTLVLIGRS
jgi:drug/metabolite transporter (DMT)-like permease